MNLLQIGEDAKGLRFEVLPSSKSGRLLQTAFVPRAGKELPGTLGKNICPPTLDALPWGFDTKPYSAPIPRTVQQVSRRRQILA